jgi:leader peptidase (prepilin peptidase)/N-methyltransferase
MFGANYKMLLKKILAGLFCCLLFVLLFYKYFFSAPFFIFSLMTVILILISVCDYRYRIIPDKFSVLLLVCGVAGCFFNTTLGETYQQRFLHSLLGIFAGGGALFLIGTLGQLFYKKEALGGGDVKLMAGIGAFLGWDKVLLAIFLAALLGSLVGLFLILTKKIDKKGYIPIGPFLAAASYVMFFVPPSLINKIL